MNIKIDHDRFIELTQGKQFLRLMIGSRLFKTHKAGSDIDSLIIIKEQFDGVFQYTDETLKTDFIVCSLETFKEKAIDGSDIVMFEALFNDNLPDYLKGVGRVNYRTIKAYLGLAERDLKEYMKHGEKDKLYHYLRCGLKANRLLLNDMVDFFATARAARQVADSNTKFQPTLAWEKLEEMKKELNSRLALKQIEY